MSSLARRLLWALAFVGLGASLTSLYVHHQLLANPTYTSFCDVNDAVSCTQAYLSQYGSVRGVPVALVGTLWFALVLVTMAVGRLTPKSLQDAVPAYLFLASVVGLADVIYLAYVATFVLRVVCILCMITWVAHTGLFIVLGVSTPLSMTTLPRRFLGDLRALVSSRVALTVIVLFLAGAASSVAYFAHAAEPNRPLLPNVPGGDLGTGGQTPESEYERWYLALPRTTVPVPSDGSAVVIVKFSDYQCPSCGASFFSDRPVIARLQGQYPGQVKYATKDYPLQPDCNPAVTRTFHLAACDAAAAVRLAKVNGKGEALSEWLYANGSRLSPALVREAARTIGGVMDFDGGYKQAVGDIRSDVSLGRLLGVSVTPTYFINGARIDGAPDPKALEFAIRYELTKAGKTK